MARSTALTVLAVLVLLTPLQHAFQITGPPLRNGPSTEAVPVRQEINSFAVAGASFDLYILALQQVQMRNQSEPLSYFQIAGIHGYPAKAWDNVGGQGSYPGFCMHAAVVFPTWHRAYLALFEQVIWTQAQVVAATYPASQRDAYVSAAQTLRLPYWDWALNPKLPTVTAVPTLWINTPDGYREIKNPLYEYVFHPGPEGNGFPRGHPLADLPATTRYYNLSSKQRSDVTASSILQANAASTLSMTYQLLSSVTDYNNMSCTYPGGRPNRIVNLESIHNNIHNFVGGYYGTMTWPELAAFDPIFWLHHANVDRLFALWQALNPQAYILPATNAFGSFAEARGTIDSETSQLAPFHIDDGTKMFTSRDLRTIQTLGYTYPELTSQNQSPADLTLSVRNSVNRLYASSATSTVKRGVLMHSDTLEEAFAGLPFARVKKMGINNQAIQWSIHIEVDRASLDTSYNIDFFIGKKPASVAHRAVAKNLVGTYGQFVVDSSCVDDPHAAATLSGEVALTHVLAAGVARGFLRDLLPESVLPVLRKHFIWTARTADNQNIDLCSLRGLLISVHSRYVQPRLCDTQFPTYGSFEVHTEATEHKVGGFQGVPQANLTK